MSSKFYIPIVVMVVSVIGTIFAMSQRVGYGEYLSEEEYPDFLIAAVDDRWDIAVPLGRKIFDVSAFFDGQPESKNFNDTCNLMLRRSASGSSKLNFSSVGNLHEVDVVYPHRAGLRIELQKKHIDQRNGLICTFHFSLIE